MYGYFDHTNPRKRVFLWALKMFAGAALQAVIAAIIFAVGAGSGWAVKSWKDGAQIALVNSQKDELESRNAILETANGNCATDIEGVKKGVAVVVAQIEERERAASAAMAKADVLVAQRKKEIAAIKNLPPVPPEPEAQCVAIVQEQIGYVQKRHE